MANCWLVDCKPTLDDFARSNCVAQGVRSGQQLVGRGRSAEKERADRVVACTALARTGSGRNPEILRRVGGTVSSARREDDELEDEAAHARASVEHDREVLGRRSNADLADPNVVGSVGEGHVAKVSPTEEGERLVVLAAEGGHAIKGDRF